MIELETVFTFLIQFMLMIVIILTVILHDRYKRTTNYAKGEKLWYQTRQQRREHVYKLKLERLKQGKKQ